jgi:3-oxoacyl-[acyl-carrier protein] reductase
VKGVGQDAADRLRDVVKAGVPLRAASTAEDVAAVVTFLADPGVASHDRVVVPVEAGSRLPVVVVRVTEPVPIWSGSI